MNKAPFLVRDERMHDIAAIHALTAAAFAGMPHSEQTEPFIVDALRAAGDLSLSLVAAEGDGLLGHIAFSPVSISDGSTNWYGLGPVSVVPARQGEGIGSALIRQGLRRLRERGAMGCVVLGDPAYYARFGFRQLPALRFEGAPPEYFMGLAFGESVAEGVVNYRPGFFARGLEKPGN